MSVNLPLPAALVKSNFTITAPWMSYFQSVGNQAYFTNTANGLLVKTGVNRFAGRQIIGSSDVIVTNGNGVLGNPTLTLSSSGVAAGSYTTANITVNSTGRIISASNGTYKLPTSASVTRTVVSKFSDVVSALDFGMVGDNSTNNTAQFNSAMAYCTANFKILYIPAGFYRFNSRPNVLTGGVSIVGEGLSATFLVRNYTETTPTNGFIHIQGTNSPAHIKDLQLTAGTGTTGGAALALVSTSTTSPDFSILQNIRIAGSGSWSKGFYADGTARTAGLRDGRAQIMVFSCTDYGFDLRGIKVWSITGAAHVAGTGTAANINLTGSSGNNAFRVMLILESCTNITLDYLEDSSIYTSEDVGTLTATSNVTRTCFYGRATTFSLAWTSSMAFTNSSLQGPNFWNDTYNNTILSVSPGSTTTVNYLDIQNAATNVGPTIEATGTDSDIYLNLLAKGTRSVAAQSTGTDTPFSIVNQANTARANHSVGAISASRTYTYPDASGNFYVSSGPDVALADGGTNASLTASNGGIVYSTATAMAILSGTATANKILMSGSSSAPSWSIPTYPNASATAGRIIRSDGTNYAASTFTIPDTYSQGDVIYASASNTLTALAKNTSSTRYLSNTGTSNNPAWAQIDLTNGVTGALPIANGGTNATSASSARTNLGIVWEPLSTQTASASASLNFASVISSTYIAYAFVISRIVPATDNTDLYLLVTTDNGSSYISTTYQYFISTGVMGGANTDSTSASASQILLATALGNSTNENCSGILYATNTGSNEAFTWNLNVYDQAPQLKRVRGDGGRINATLTGVKFQMSSGNITSGSITCYGIRA